PGRSSKNEQEIVSKDGRLFRVDRAIVDAESVTVVDFKTGGRDLEEKYKKQVRAYLTLLADLYPGRRLRGVLAYVDRGMIVEVT
ncbi:MAG: PD-(D/E)XK nuclease family protein, partial [Bacteroidota bacterium]